MRRKGHLPDAVVVALIGFGLLPLLMVLARLCAYPGGAWGESIGQLLFCAVGTWLNRELTLLWVPPEQTRLVLYLLLLPASALFITLARLTFGLRVLGFRAILVAVGFQEIGLTPSLVLIAVILVVTVVVRPGLRKARLPLYARVSVILCLTAAIMVAALFVGPWLRSESIWAVAFFPVIILAMLAEGFAKTMDRDSIGVALGRGAATLLVALLIAWFSQRPVVRELMLHAPELMLSQSIAVVLVSEFLDLRLFQGWQGGRGGHAGKAAESVAVPRVAIIRNRTPHAWIGAGRANARGGSVQHLVDALRACGYRVRVFEQDQRLVQSLARFVPALSQVRHDAVVFHPATEAVGSARVRAALEMGNYALAGPGAATQALLEDRYTMLTLLRAAGVAVPRVWLISAGETLPSEAAFPLIVQARALPSAAAELVTNEAELHDFLARARRMGESLCVAEPKLAGDEFHVAVLGNSHPRCLPAVQVDAAGRYQHCPAPVARAVAERLEALSLAAFRALDCRDYARVDLHQCADGHLRVMAVRCHGIFARRGAFLRAAEVSGYSLSDLLGVIVDMARARKAVPGLAEGGPWRG